MQSLPFRHGYWWALIGSALLGIGMVRDALAQQTPGQEPFGGAAAAPRTPIPPSPSIPAVAAETAPLSHEAQLEERVRQLEAMVNQLSTQMQQGASRGGSGAGAAGADVGSRASAALPSTSGGPGAPGQSLPPNPAPSARFDSPATLENKKANVKFGPGFEIRTDDDEFIVQFHNLTQFEYRGYQQYGQSSVHDSFLIPRQWFMFSGRITKPIGYFVSMANGFDTFSLLDVFLDLQFDPRFVVRAGRFKTPFTYEFLVEPLQGLILPERSLFFNNFGLNRDLGVMGYGRLFANTLDYAAGIFNGARNGFVAPTDDKFFAAYANFKPFVNAEGSVLENFNIGGSVLEGNEQIVPIPAILRTNVPTTGNAVAGVPFLAFNSNVRQSGSLSFWDLHTAWYYQQLAVLAEWQSGFQDYAQTSNLAARTHLPVQSYYIEAGYLLTGETRSSVGIVKPRHPFNLKQGQFGLGAWELTGRYNFMDIGSQVFKNGLADQNLWANRLYTTNLGFNWHINQYLKFYFTWEHAEFNQPVIYAPTHRQATSDMFMARIQLYF
jgi:phosphate-selective porin OprO and OprP